MSDNRFRVKVEDESGRLLVLEVFDKKDDAKEYYKALQKDEEDNPLYILGADTLVISLEEESAWEVRNRKVIDKG